MLHLELTLIAATEANRVIFGRPCLLTTERVAKRPPSTVNIDKIATGPVLGLQSTVPGNFARTC